MDQVRAAIKLLHNSNARHLRKGFKYRDNTTPEMLKHAAEELVELVEANSEYRTSASSAMSAHAKIIEELADLIMILLHYAHSHGITNTQLQNSMLDKFVTRFALTQKETAAIKKLQRQLNAHHRQKLRLYGDEEA